MLLVPCIISINSFTSPQGIIISMSPVRKQGLKGFAQVPVATKLEARSIWHKPAASLASAGVLPLLGGGTGMPTGHSALRAPRIIIIIGGDSLLFPIPTLAFCSDSQGGEGMWHGPNLHSGLSRSEPRQATFRMSLTPLATGFFKKKNPFYWIQQCTFGVHFF